MHLHAVQVVLGAAVGGAGRDDAGVGAGRARVQLRGQLARVVARHDLGAGAVLVAAGCGAFLAPELAPDGWRMASYAGDVAPLAIDASEALQRWVQVGAPAVAVASLFAEAIAGEMA